MFPPLSPQADAFVSRYFEREILPVLTPIAVDAAHPLPRAKRGSRDLVVSIPNGDGGQKPYGVVLVHASVPRVLNVPEGDGEIAVPLEHLIARFLTELFPRDAISKARVSSPEPVSAATARRVFAGRPLRLARWRQRSRGVYPAYSLVAG